LEAFDRFSRQDIDESERALIDLLKLGVDIHVAFNNKTFNCESTKSLVDRIEILVSLKQAHDFSENLSKRIKSAKQQKTAQLRAGKIVKHNNVPKYFSWSEKTLRYEQNKGANLVAKLVNEYLAGNSLYSIAARLNREKVPSFKTGGNWSPRSLKCIFCNRILIGEYFDNPKFFEPILDVETFQTLQLRLKDNSTNRGKASDLVNIFKGIVYCKCGCHMNIISQSVDYRTKKNWSHAYRYLRCSSVSAGNPCEYKFCINAELIEFSFFWYALTQNPESLVKTDTTETKRIQTDINRLQFEEHELTLQIQRLLELTKSVVTNEVKTKYIQVTKQRDSIIAERDRLNGLLLKSKAAPTQFKDLSAVIDDYWKLENAETKADSSKADILVANAEHHILSVLKDNNIRTKIKNILPRIIGKLVIDSKCRISEIFNHSGKPITKYFIFGPQRYIDNKKPGTE
jgi:hypothetical protein